MISAIGFVGAILLIICGIPQLIKTLKTKSVEDLSLTYFLLWLFGCLCMLVYTIALPPIRWPMILDYVISSIIAAWLAILVIIYKK